MRRIYTYGGRAVTRNLTVADLQANKAAGIKLTQVSALNGAEAAACEAAGIDLLSLRRAVAAERLKGLAGFRDAVKAGTFPHEPHQVPMTAGESEKLREALDAWRPVHQ